MATRLISASQPWEPWKYQERGVVHLLGNHAGALFLDPGLGKTAIVLEAFRLLQSHKMAHRMLVVAPLRVCQLVWRQEGQKWSQFRELTFSLMHGPKKLDRLHDPTDIHLINPEGIPWLSQQFYGRTDLPWDVVTIDEITAFKNHRAIRSKRLRAKLGQVRYRWGLTGTPAPNGYMDLFGQMLMLDDGASLGKYITHFRDKYFQQEYDGFTYKLRQGAAERIEARIAPYVLRMAAADYLELPPLVEHIIQVVLPDEARKQYNELKKEMILSLPEGHVTAANTAAVYTKLKQITNGAVYINPQGDFAEVHDAKLAALEELIEELAGQPLLVAYEFQSDLERIRKRLGEDTPTLTGASEKQITALEAAWNRGELPVLLVHPASAGHGLNLQGSGASHICWFSRPWDLSLYDQTIRRIYRQGSTAERVINHVLHINNTMDDVVADALRDKDVTQKRLLDALNASLTGDDMALKKLGFQSAEAAPAAPATPRGWGAPATEEEPAQTNAAPAPATATPRGWGAPAGTPPDPQRTAIAAKLSGGSVPPADDDEEAPASARALAAFPAGLVQSLTGEGAPASDGETPRAPAGWNAVQAAPEAAAPEKPVRSRRKAAEPTEAVNAPAKDETTFTGAATEQIRAFTGQAIPTLPYEYNEPVRIELNGIPRHAVAAALMAIANSMRERAG